MPLNRLQDSYSAMVMFFLLSFVGFSITVWSIFAGTSGLAVFGLAFIFISVFVSRHSIPKHMLFGATFGAIGGALLAFPIGFFLGEFLDGLFGLFAAALWGAIIALVLFFIVAKYIFRFLPYAVQTGLFVLVILAGIFFGITGMGTIAHNIYDPISGTMLLGWVGGMICGAIVGYRLQPDVARVQEPISFQD